MTDKLEYYKQRQGSERAELIGNVTRMVTTKTTTTTVVTMTTTVMTLKSYMATNAIIIKRSLVRTN